MWCQDEQPRRPCWGPLQGEPFAIRVDGVHTMLPAYPRNLADDPVFLRAARMRDLGTQGNPKRKNLHCLFVYLPFLSGGVLQRSTDGLQRVVLRKQRWGAKVDVVR